MDKQLGVGIGNKNVNIHIEDLIVSLEDGNEINALKFFDAYVDAIKKYDDEIKSKIGKEVLVNKTNTQKEFSISKIITSLLSIGIPLDAAFSISKRATESMLLLCNEGNGQAFDTKLIRKTICDSIQAYDTKKYSSERIQSWGQKYVRKYGRNNQVVKLQYLDGEIREINIKVMSDFIDDVITTISPNIIPHVDLSKNDRSGLIECVLDFVNSCDVYIIKYDVLKAMILEIALQPPHPWFINQATKDNIMKYDYEQLKTNLAKISRFFNTGEKIVPQSILIEVIHHAASLLLAGYDYFLGYNDLSSLYLLTNSIEKLINRPYNELLFDEFPINKLLADITKAEINYNEFLKLLQEIQNQVNSTYLSSADFSKRVFDFGTQAKLIHENKTGNSIDHFLSTSWDKMARQDIISNLKKIIKIIFGYSSHLAINTPAGNVFWHHVDNFASNIFDAKKNILVFYGGNNADVSEIEFVCKGQAKTICNLIIVISEAQQSVNLLKNSIKEMFEKMGCGDSFIIISLCKRDLEKLYNSLNPSKCFEGYIVDQLLNR